MMQFIDDLLVFCTWLGAVLVGLAAIGIICVIGYYIQEAWNKFFDIFSKTWKISKLENEISELKAMLKDYQQPDMIWQHYKGGFYKLICCARMEGTGQRVVVYQSLKVLESVNIAPAPLEETTYVRPREEFLEKFKHQPENNNGQQ